ncbi:Synaptotagmin-C [Dufourea novaeangliae]|uniref:Synaptotagmin-C n=1 Tax=Dufourea novaeangliae TaxID=178035 RepID=A0A154P6S9_DUFNO|nr:Synaptotagmin-C [Dufourea novaeangliae]
MISSAIFGAAAGTGLALVVAMTIVVYRYYAVKRKGKYWSNLDRWPDPPTTRRLEARQEDPLQHSHDPSSSHVLNCWKKQQKNYYAVQNGDILGLPKDPPTSLNNNKKITKNYLSLKDYSSIMPSKLSEVLGDVLELACGGGGGGGGTAAGRGNDDPGKSGNSIGSAASRIGVVAGVATIRERWAQRGHRSPLSSVANTDSADSITSTSSEEFNVAKEKHAVQPCSSVVVESGSLPHQSRSYPGGSGGSGGSTGRLLTRNSSVSSQSSVEGQQQQQQQSHRSTSHIRAFGPDGRHHHYHHHHRDPLHAASSYPPSRSSRSPSPGRAASLDARCGNPASCSGSLLSSNASRSQSSLSSLATGVSSSCGGSSISVAHGASRSAGRSLSPLLIPPIRASGSEGGPPPPASPLGSLQPDLYQRRDGPIFLKSHGNGKCLGRLHLQFKYDFNRSDLHVHLIEAHDLAGSDQGGFNDPYVKLTLSPEVDARKRQTQIYRNEANPFFDQQFKFPVSHDDFHDKILVLDYDRFSRNDVVGSVKVPLHILRLDSPSSTEEIWGEIERERKPPEQIQEVLLSLSYLPSAERLKVVIVKARNLFPPQQEKETLDSFVKVNLLCAEKRIKKKTAVKKATTSPIWNEAMSFDVPANSLPSSAIEVRVMDSSNEIVGSCIIGPATGATPGLEGSGSHGREHWLHMTQSPRETIAMWHTLH